MKRQVVLDDKQAAYAERSQAVEEMSALLEGLMRQGVTEELLVMQARTIVRAHAVGSERWALTARDGIASVLTVGKIYGVAIWTDGVDLMASETTLDRQKLDNRADRGHLEMWGPYPAVKRDDVWSVRFGYLPAREFSRTFAMIEAAHEAATRPAALSGLNPAPKDAHHPGLVLALSRLTGIALPQPSYVLPDALAGVPPVGGSGGASTSPASPTALPKPPAADIFDEGRVVTRLVDVRERDRQGRAAAIAIHGARCRLCGFDFGTAYGPDAAGLIHVHHLQPLAEGRRVTDPATDLVPLCANCHMVVHSRDPMLDLDVVRAMLGDRARRV